MTTEKKTSRIQQQQRSELGIKILKAFYKDVNGKLLSQTHRLTVKEDAALTYGEIIPESFMQILSLCGTCNTSSSSSLRGTFVDLGKRYLHIIFPYTIYF